MSYVGVARSLGSLQGPFPPEVSEFLNEVEKEPARHQRLLMSVSTHLNPIPDDTLAAILEKTRPAVKKAIDASPDPADTLKGARSVLGMIRVGQSNSDPKFARQFKDLEDLSNRVDTAFSCVATFRRLRHHFPNASKLPIPFTVTGLVKSGKRFILDPEFQHDFPRLSKLIRTSGFPEIIQLSVGFNLKQAAEENKKDHEGFKQRARQVCKTRTQAEKATSSP